MENIVTLFIIASDPQNREEEMLRANWKAALKLLNDSSAILPASEQATMRERLFAEHTTLLADLEGNPGDPHWIDVVSKTSCGQQVGEERCVVRTTS